jgi:hypothetical protein
LSAFSKCFFRKFRTAKPEPEGTSLFQFRKRSNLEKTAAIVNPPNTRIFISFGEGPLVSFAWQSEKGYNPGEEI